MNSAIDIIKTRIYWEIGDMICALPLLLIVLCVYGFIWWICRK